MISMKRILIADDALELGRLLQTVFLTLDPTFSINVVPSAEEALLESRGKPIDLLISDVRLPGMSGLDLVKKMRVRNPTLRVIIMTGLTDPRVMDTVRELNVNGFFQKPVDMNAFLSVARKCLDMPAEAPPSAQRAPAGVGAATAPVPPAPNGLDDTTAAQNAAPPLREGVGESISGLRQRLGALAVFLLDERGRIVVQAGDVPDLPYEGQWINPVMSALSAGQKVARLAGEGVTPHAMAFPGKNYHLVLAPAGDYALLALLPHGRSVLRMAVAVEEMLEIQQRLGEILAEMKPKHKSSEPALPLEVVLPRTAPLTLPEQIPVPEPVVPEPRLQEFEALFQHAQETTPGQDVDAFWDALSAAGQPGVTGNSDVLTYEQARQLGLTPQDDK
jgi:DNA-binding NarL/FixJ family response regulator